MPKAPGHLGRGVGCGPEREDVGDLVVREMVSVADQSLDQAGRFGGPGTDEDVLSGGDPTYRFSRRGQFVSELGTPIGAVLLAGAHVEASRVPSAHSERQVGFGGDAVTLVVGVASSVALAVLRTPQPLARRVVSRLNAAWTGWVDRWPELV